MGIPGLKRLLEPYALPPDCKLEPCEAAIDGPAFAYHILGLCQRKTLMSSPFEQPSYAALGQTAIDWLSKIEKHGIHVSAIFFDGLLPTSKREERMQRLLATTKQLERYRLAYPEGVPRQRVGFNEDTTVELFPRTRGKAVKVAAPTPSFLVPAVIDALANSPEYATRLQVVAGEADGFCAEKVRSHRGAVVLTSDSDLLVHDLGHGNGVVFFADLGFDVDEKGLVAPVFYIDEICQRLSLKSEHGLARLAFELVNDLQLTIEQAAKLSRGDTAAAITSPSRFTKFLEPYLSPETVPGTNHLIDGPLLDPRISELALRCLPENSEEAALRADAESSTLELYLPFLLDYGLRTSAWEASKSIRKVGYTLLQLVLGRPIPWVAEFRRPQSQSSGVQVGCFSCDELTEKCSALMSLLSRVTATKRSLEATWTVLAFYLDVELSLHQGKERPQSFELLRQYAMGILDQGSWEFIHVLAHVHALLYSLRFLKQVTEFTARHAPGGVRSEIAGLGERLAIIPPLNEFPSARNFGEAFRKFWMEGGLECLREVCSGEPGIVEHIGAIEGIPAQKKGKKTKKRKASVLVDVAPAQALSRNPFDILAGHE